MTLLPNILSAKPASQLLLLQSSSGQSSLSIVRRLIRQRRTLLFSFLYEFEASEDLEIHNYLHHVPGYGSLWLELKAQILRIVRSKAGQSIDVVIDSVDTIASDAESDSETFLFLHELFSIVAQDKSSRLILHLCTPSSILPLLADTSFSPSLVHLIAHPPVILTHIAAELSTLPPPAGDDAKFWAVFLPIQEREYETDHLVFGAKGEGIGNPSEFVVEVIVRAKDLSGRRKGVERVLEGWNGSPCELNELQSLKGLWKKTGAGPSTAPLDPAQNLSFNLNLTPSQQASRAKIPLPYAHEGKSIANAPPAIFYDPDSADDLDDDDPDEDLDI
ncbi:hypothetical protein C8J56DRAFT_1041322 [Mycena floridula]|nr:hypothetical protein C8J56DRAFT_1041322 [Mycena floridula]